MSRYKDKHDFLNKTPIVGEIRVRIEKWDCIRFKSFYTSKETKSSPTIQWTKE
jgi:hypothetical protein